MKKVNRFTAALMFLIICTVTIFTSCGSKKETVESSAELTENSSDTASAIDGEDSIEQTSDDSEEPEGTATEDAENEMEEEETTEELNEAAAGENDTTAEEPEGQTTDTENEDTTTAESIASGTTTANNSGSTTSQNSGGSTTTTTTAQTTTSSGYTYTSLNQTMYAKSAVNVRSTPNSSGTKLGSLTAGQSVTVTGQCNETSWYRISYNGGTGYVSNNYLTSTKPSETTTQQQTTTKKSETTTTKKTETTTTTKSATTTTRTYATEEEKLAIIEGINNYRAKQGYTEMPVVLNTFLTEQAQEWAEYLAANDACYTSLDNNYIAYLSGDYFWNFEKCGVFNLLGKDLSSWIYYGEYFGEAMYACPFIGVGVAVNSAGKTVLVVQGIREIYLYEANGEIAFDEMGGSMTYNWYATDENGDVDFTKEDPTYIQIVNKIYETGHFADFICALYYDYTYGDDYYKYTPSWMKNSVSWVS